MWDALQLAPARGGLAGEEGCIIIIEMLEEEEEEEDVRVLMLSLSSLSLSLFGGHDDKEEELLTRIGRVRTPPPSG